MSSLSLRVRYRPIRIGWCIESGSVAQLESALRLTHAFVGGRFNPVIPVNDTELAENLIDCFRVDLLFPVAETALISSFVGTHNYLHWPRFSKTLFHEAWQHIPPRSALVDVYHPARALREARGRRRRLLLPAWGEADPLAMVFLAMLGRYPPPSTAIPDYQEMLTRILGTEELALQPDAPVPPDLRTRLTPSRLTAVGL